jgi:cellulose synthase/poly-beta-1,6-N-acetylglucosamine synthase-like glycosyltransferase
VPDSAVRSAQSVEFAELLLGSGLITPEQLDLARSAKARTGAHIDEVLVSLGMLDAGQVRELESTAWGYPASELATETTDPAVLRLLPYDRYLRQSWIPLRREPDGRILVATARVPDESRTAGITEALGETPHFVVTSSWDIRKLVLREFAPEIADNAANELYRQNPELSARVTFSRGQAIGLIATLAVIVGLAIIWPYWVIGALLTVIGLFFLAGTLFKLIVSLRGARFDVIERISAGEIAALTDEELPSYSVLVPVFREANIVGQLVGNLGRLDYPVDKLEVLVLIEEEDDLTRSALAAVEPPAHFHVVTIPKGQPQTKPRACNVGLFVATGELLVIYDAEDAPDADQLKKAVIAFRRGGMRTMVVQAALNYFNATENALTRMFTLEYSYWFDYMLPGLEAADLPIPLGGTSNHFRTSALLELGGWDPYNVTEDADLGIRASALGGRVGVIDSTTMEEANNSIPNFIRQRSRWIKGYLQTVLVHARHPVRLIREIGLGRFLAFALLIGGTPATFLAIIPLYLATIVAIFVPPEIIAQAFPPWVLWLGLVNLVIGSSVITYVSMMGPYKRGDFHLILWALLNPVYWILHSIASYKAVWQLLTKPHYWEKTEHGLTTQSHGEAAAQRAMPS